MHSLQHCTGLRLLNRCVGCSSVSVTLCRWSYIRTDAAHADALSFCSSESKATLSLTILLSNLSKCRVSQTDVNTQHLRRTLAAMPVQAKLVEP